MYFDHEIRPLDARAELFSWCKRRVSIICNIRADFNAHISISAIRLFVKRTEQIAGCPNIFDRELPEDLLRIPTSPGERREGGVIVVRLRDRVVENGGVGGHATNVSALDHLFQIPVFQEYSLNIIEPEGLT